MAQDHLLLVSRYRFSETYKRFYFRDIQAVVIARTDRWKAWFIAFAITGSMMSAFGAWSAGWDRIFWGVLAAFSLLMLIVNLVLGPSCSVFLRTAVQTVELLPLRRLKPARKTADLLRSAIEGAQGRLSRETIEASVNAIQRTGIVIPKTPSPGSINEHPGLPGA